MGTRPACLGMTHATVDGTGWGFASLIWLIAVVVAVIVGDAARTLAWVFRGLFEADSPKPQVVLGYGGPALVYLGVARLVGYGVSR